MMTSRTPERRGRLRGDFFIDSKRCNISEELLLPVSHSAAFVPPFFVVKTDYVEQSVNNEGENSLVEGNARCIRLFMCPFERDYNITDHFTRENRCIRSMGGQVRALPGEVCKVGKGDYVCGPVSSEELPVELLYLPVADEQDAYVPIL